MEQFQISILLTIAILIFGNSEVFATQQIPDRIIIEGVEYELNSFPLESYFLKNPYRRPQGDCMSTGLWRGYIATFIVKNNELYLKHIKVQIRDEAYFKENGTDWKDVKDIYLGEIADLKLDWISQVLVLRKTWKKRRNANYDHLLLAINNGTLGKTKNLSEDAYEKYKKQQFEAFCKTEAYPKLIDELCKNAKCNGIEIEWYIERTIFEHTSKLFIEMKE